MLPATRYPLSDVPSALELRERVLAVGGTLCL
jgi:hypothetical protein